MIRQVLLLLKIAAVIGFTGTAALAQTVSEGRQWTVGDLEIRFIELENVAPGLVRANIQSAEGAAYDESLIDSDIRSLYRTGLFEYIEVKRDFQSDGTVDLIFELRPKYRVAGVYFKGEKEVTRRRLNREVTIRKNDALDERNVRLDAEKLHEFYQNRGFSEAVVTYNIERDRSSGTGIVTFIIDEGRRVKIKRVEFTGNDSISDRRLRKAMETRRWHIFSWLTGSGRFKDEVFEDDLDKLRDYYREEGFLDVAIDPDQVTFDYPSDSKMILTIPIEEGRQYSVGEITIEGNELYTEGELRSALELKPGDVFVPSQLDADVERLRDYYGKDGYLDTRVRGSRRPNVESGNIDIAYEILEGTQHHVGSIEIEGNTKTKSTVIIRELGLGPGDVFNTVRMKSSQRRLQNTRFFEEVTLTPAPTEIPGRRDLRITVKEGRTGSVTFGVGFSTLERAIAYAEYRESNFDIFNYRSKFQGGGQKLQLRVQVGTRSNELLLAFEEPYLFQRELAFGFQIFRAETRYLASTYDELRTGFEVYFRKRLIELVEGRISYRYEIVDIFDVKPDAPSPIVEGERSVSKVGFSLLRDTRDSILAATRGNRVELLTEVAGGPFQGETDYFRIEGRAAQFFPTFETLNQVFSIVGRLGTVIPHSGADEVPFFDRYFLGGPYDLRGFDYRDVGPSEGSDRIGGNSFGFASAEYSIELVNPVRFAVFYDWGFVNSDKADFDFSDYNDNWGFGLRILVMGAPMRLDYGIPITTDEFNDEGGRFSFSFGTRF